MPVVTVDVDVDLDDFSDDDIAEEYESRGLGAGGDLSELLNELFYAFYFGKDDRAMQIARRLAQDATGRVIP
jgi:hypothetical protein